ncbi:hypothetical protein [Maricaulis sp. CAU 1757]
MDTSAAAPVPHPEGVTRPARPADRFQPFEFHLYDRSPLSFWLTTVGLLVLTYGFYVLVAELTGRPPMVVEEAGQRVIPQVAWIGFVLSLILTAGIAFTEAGRRLWQEESEALARALSPSAGPAISGMVAGAPMSWRSAYRGVFLAGALAGLAFNLFLMVSMQVAPWTYMQSIGLWFLVVSPPLYGTGFRAGVEVARESREIKALIRDHLEVDLFRLDDLAVFGRLGLRAVRSWLIMAAILLLFLIDPGNPSLFAADQIWVSIPAVLASILGGLVILWNTLHPVHVRIQAAKKQELERVHEEMRKAREAALAGDRSAASALAGLTDYEIWVGQRPEWPVSAGLTTRMSVYVLLPLIPILGSYLFEKLADHFIAGGA